MANVLSAPQSYAFRPPERETTRGPGPSVVGEWSARGRTVVLVAPAGFEATAAIFLSEFDSDRLDRMAQYEFQLMTPKEGARFGHAQFDELNDALQHELQSRASG